MRNWDLIIPLAGLSLVLPAVRAVVDGDVMQGPGTSSATTAVVAVIWVITAVRQHIARPVAALATAGLLAGLGLIVLQNAVAALATDAHAATPAAGAMAHAALTCAAWGATLGAVADVAHRTRASGSPRSPRGVPPSRDGRRRPPS